MKIRSSGKFLILIAGLLFTHINLANSEMVNFQGFDFLYLQEEETPVKDVIDSRETYNSEMRKISETEKYWREYDQVWEDYSEKRLEYGENGLIMRTIIFGFQNDKKIQTGTDEFQYNNSGKVLKILQKRNFNKDVGSDIQRYRLFQYKYNSSGTLTEEIVQLWEKNNWQNMSAKRYFYGNDGNLSEVKEMKWNKNDWILDKRTTFKYNDQQHLIEELIEEYLMKQVFTTHYITYKLDEDGRRIETLKRTGIIGNWKFNEFLVQSYNRNGNPVQKIKKQYNNKQWNKISKSIYKYAQDQLIEETEQVWVDSEGWVDLKKIRLNYKLMTR